MSDDEDDYLSDKFLASLAEPPKPAKASTYSDLRKQAAQRSEERARANRAKSAKERREEALSKTLFERAQEEEEAAARRRAEEGAGEDAAGAGGGGNKALAMMMKMGFKPGMALGKSEEDAPKKEEQAREKDASPEPGPSQPRRGGLIEPIAVKEWTGKQGIGVSAKRKAEFDDAARDAKSARVESEADFLARSAAEHAARRAEGRLRPAQRTCMQLDEGAGVRFSVLWLNAAAPDVFPPGLYDAVGAYVPLEGALSGREEMLRRQMRAERLVGLEELEEGGKEEAPSEEDVREAVAFLALDPVSRLDKVLAYLRSEYRYCFWCGTRYVSADEMAQDCPGADEEVHD